MKHHSILRQRRPKAPKRPLRAAFTPAVAGGGAALAYPGYASPDEEGNRRTFVTGSIATLFHGGILAFLVIAASLAPVIDEEIIPVQLLRETPEPIEPAPAPKALAERRSVNFSPAVQAFEPQIVNPRVIADASPAIQAQALEMDAVSSTAAPTQINRATTVVERVSAVNSVARARAAQVDVGNTGAPVVRGPVRVTGPVGPSVGPRKVQAAATGTTSGTALEIGGNGSSVGDGVLSGRDVVGSPDGALVVSVDTAVGDSYMQGTGGSGTGPGGAPVSKSMCLERPEVLLYMTKVEERVYERWILPPGVDADQRVTLRFRLDVAGSATTVALVRASDNALGASAVDALRAASPFPPMPEPARCLASVPIIATFSNPVAG